MTVNIRIWDALDDIRGKHHIKYGDWAEASEMQQPRFSELKRISRAFQRGEKNLSGRAFTVQKCCAMIAGLRKLLGDSVVQKELFDKCSKEEDIDVRLVCMMAALDLNEKQQVEMFLKAFVKKVKE